jgi:hypothetical protein
MDIWRAPGPDSGQWSAAGTAIAGARFISSTRDEFAAQYAPNGARIAFKSARSGNEEIWVCDSEGSGLHQLTDLKPRSIADPRWSPDSRWIAFSSRTDALSRIYIVAARGGPVRRLTPGDSEDVYPNWSHDGKWIYFGSNRSGGWQIWKIPPRGGKAARVTRNGGWTPFESWDGKHLYYQKFTAIPGIWKTPVSGGQEVKILDFGMPATVSVLRDGICLFRPDAKPRPRLEFYRFGDLEPSSVGLLPPGTAKVPRIQNPIGISPDGRWVLYAQADKIDDDIMLVENFR